MFKKIIEWYKSQPDTVKGAIWLGIVLIIGIVIRWDFVMDGIRRGFGFYSK
ncbi:MAG: hypothetical protein KBS57_02075 [Alistipes sp.]|nr:hypothetical protein [Candidatus Minthomonas equi]